MAVVLPGIWPSEGSVFPLTTPPGSDQQTPWCHHKVSLLSLHTPRETPKTQPPLKPGETHAHTPRNSSRSLELSSLSLIYPLSSSSALSAQPGPPC